MEYDLESNGWRQGSIARSNDVPELVADIVDNVPNGSVLVIISQSCDLARSKDTEPYVEAILAESIASPKGNFTHNRNGRTLDIPVKVAVDDSAGIDDSHLRLRAINKISVPKGRFVGCGPDEQKVIPLQSRTVLAEWLGGRYSRAAFPSDFNDALVTCDPSNRKLRRIAKQLSPHTAGLYFEIEPNRDLLDGEKYRVNVLGMIIPSAAKHREDVERDLARLKGLMETAGMDVQARVRTEGEVSVAVRKRMRRMHLNDISYRTDGPEPVNISV